MSFTLTIQTIWKIADAVRSSQGRVGASCTPGSFGDPPEDPLKAKSRRAPGETVRCGTLLALRTPEPTP